MPRFSPLIVEHFTNPANAGELSDPDLRAVVGNPVCGDQIDITVRLSDGVVQEAKFVAYGCAAALGTASVITSELSGRRPAELTTVTEDDIVRQVGGLAPDQRHCATLGRDVLHALASNAARGTNDAGLSVRAATESYP